MRRKRKPDLLAALVIVVGLGVIATAFAQSLFITTNTETHIASNQTQAAANVLRERGNH